MSAPAPLRLLVNEVTDLTPSLRALTLTRTDGGPLPRFSPGGHITVHAGADAERRNAYSLACDPARTDGYQVIVRRVDPGRGGSAWLHDELLAGQTLTADQPRNLFFPPSSARRHLLVAGGVGITPFISYAHHFKAAGTPFELHFAGRADEADAFATVLDRVGLESSPWIHTGGRSELLVAVERALLEQPLGTHLSTCGPAAMMEAVVELAQACGWSDDRIHLERFSAADGEREPFDAVVPSRSLKILVGANESLLEALERHEIAIPYLCRQGVCGECITRLISGAPDHRDVFLTAQERERCDVLLPCVSRGASKSDGPLVLDIQQEAA